MQGSVASGPQDMSSPAFFEGSPSTVWARLQLKPGKELRATHLTDPNNAAWVKLAVISKEDSTNKTLLGRDLIEWRNQNPNHPGNALFPSDSSLSTLQTLPAPKHIILLLPLQGAYGKQGQAVRDGFLNAYFEQLGRTHIQQTISFYDTAQNTDIISLYQKAINEGADFVAGPLLKEEVQTLLNSGNFPVNTLALNYTDSGSLPAHFYEFGLSPLDEAEQVADKARQAGRTRAIIIASQNEWGQRVSKKVAARFRSNGGSIVETYYFTPQSDFSQDIPKLMHVNPEADQAQMRENNNKEALEKQRRQDFDVIFLLAQPQAARQIVPLLRYYYAANTPIYATSMVYEGKPNPSKDVDLEGVTFSDLPWTLKGAGASSNRLYAVGRDAYLLGNELERLTLLPNFPLYGATGALTLTPQHQIYRRLPWATIQNGRP